MKIFKIAYILVVLAYLSAIALVGCDSECGKITNVLLCHDGDCRVEVDDRKRISVYQTVVEGDMVCKTWTSHPNWRLQR